MTREATADPVLLARLALLVAWCARVEDATSDREPAYRLGSGAARCGEGEAIRHLVDLPKPVHLAAQWEADALRVQATPIASGSEETRAFEAWRSSRELLAPLTPEEDPGYAGVLVYGAGRVLRVSPGDLAAFHREYWMDVPGSAVTDLPGSDLVAELGLPPHELDGVADVIVLGRSTAMGEVFPTRTGSGPAEPAE